VDWVSSTLPGRLPSTETHSERGVEERSSTLTSDLRSLSSSLNSLRGDPGRGRGSLRGAEAVTALWSVSVSARWTLVAGLCPRPVAVK
jgi:hypothetical protein